MYCEYIERGSAGSIFAGWFAETTRPPVIDCGSAASVESISNNAATVDLVKTFIVSSIFFASLRPCFASWRETAFTQRRKGTQSRKENSSHPSFASVPAHEARRK